MNLAPHPITLRQLQYIVAIADRRSFRQAADACHVAQPSLSTQIAQVEEILGVQLFEREHRQVVTTAAGQAFVARARALLVEADALIDSARLFTDPFSATIRIGVIPTVGPYLLPLVAAAIRDAFPNLTVRWVEEKTHVLMTKLANAELDAAILAIESGQEGELPHFVIGEDEFVLASPKEHRLSRSKQPIAAESLAQERMLLLDDGHCFRQQALSFCTGVGASEASFRATSLPTLVQMIVGSRDESVTLLPSIALDVENRHGGLAIRRIKHPPSRTLALVWRRGAALAKALEGVGAVMKTTYAARVT